MTDHIPPPASDADVAQVRELLAEFRYARSGSMARRGLAYRLAAKVPGLLARLESVDAEARLSAEAADVFAAERDALRLRLDVLEPGVPDAS